MENKKLLYILIGLTTVLILVGIANLFFMGNHTPAESVEQTDEELAGLDEELMEDAAGATTPTNNQRPQAIQSQPAQASDSRATSPAQNNSSQTTPATRPQAREFNIRTWVNRSIPLTFESGGGAADSIKRQYAHIVRDLERVQQLLLQGNTQEALELIRPMLRDRGNIYREDAEWYNILALLAAENTDSGLNHLSRMLRDNIHLYYFLGTELQAEMVSIQALIQRSSGSGEQPKDAW